MLVRTLAVLLSLAACLPAQDAVAPATKPATKEKPLRVHVIGASVSGGFRDGPMFGAEEQGDSVTLQYVLKKWVGEHARATTHSTVDMLAMFTDPQKFGSEQIKGIAKARPDIVVAFDFPFWFAYGRVAGDEREARKARLAAGLELLAELSVPVLLGDLPDMQGAATRMLSPRQIPGPELLKELNAQIAAFVQQHGNFRVVPLGQMVRTMKVDGAVLPLVGGPRQTEPGALLQGDRLHATRLGMAFLGFSLQEPLRAQFPAAHPLRTQAWTFEQFVEAAGAAAELEAVLDAGKDGKGGANEAAAGSTKGR